MRPSSDASFVKDVASHRRTRPSVPARDRTRRERGAAAVEFALVFPLLLTIVLGITEFGIAFSTQARISQAAREAARTMAVGDTSTNARNAARAAAPGVALTDAQIAISPVTFVGAAAGATASITITYPYTYLTGFFGSGVTMTGTGVMRCEG